jgi:hypothetical protein
MLSKQWILIIFHNHTRGAVALLVETLCYKPDGRGFGSRWVHWIFYLPNPSVRTMVLGSNQPLTEMSTRNFTGGKGRPAGKADNLTAICEPIFKKMREPRLLATLWASMACYRDSFTYTTVLPEQPANVTEPVNARAQWRLSIGRRTTILWVFGHNCASIDGSNRLLAGRRIARDDCTSNQLIHSIRYLNTRDAYLSSLLYHIRTFRLLHISSIASYT